MTPEEQPNPAAESARPNSSAEPQRRSLRPRRGHRGRGRRRKPAPQDEAPAATTESGSLPEAAEAQKIGAEVAEPLLEPREAEEYAAPDEPGVEREPDLAEPVRSHELREERRPPAKPASPQSIQDAIDHVMHVISALRESLDEMEDVLELLEALERQIGADDREIESLRCALRQLHRGREGGPHRR